MVNTRRYLTEGSFACIVGLVGGLILLVINLTQTDIHWHVSLAFPSEYFLDVLLPPIIFYQGFSVHKNRLFSNTGSFY